MSYRHLRYEISGDSAMPDPGSPWVVYDSTGVRGYTGWRTTTLTGATRDLVVNMGETLPSGTYYFYSKSFCGAGPRIGDIGFIVGSVSGSSIGRFDDYNKSRNWWSEPTALTIPESFSSFTIRYPSYSGSAVSLYCLGYLVTSNAEEQPMMDNRLVNLTPPTSIATTGHHLGNRVPNSTFELGACGGWCYTYSWNSSSYPEEAITTVDSMKAWKLVGVPAGTASWYMGHGKQLMSTPIPLRGNRVHTVSFYAKAAVSGTLSLQALHAFQDDDGNSYSVTSGFAITSAWQRYSFTTSAQSVSWAPAKGLDLSVEQSAYQLKFGWDRTTVGHDVYINRVMVEEGSTLNPYSPKYPVEVGVIPSNVNGIYYSGDNPSFQVRAYNSTSASTTAAVVVRFFDYYGDLAGEKSVSISCSSGALGTADITLSGALPSWYKAIAYLVTDAGLEPHNEATFCVVRENENTQHSMGTFMLWNSENSPRTPIELGFKKVRTLSVGNWFSWPFAEPTEGAYVWDTYPQHEEQIRRCVTSGVEILGNLYCQSSEIQSWAHVSGQPDPVKYANFAEACVEKYGSGPGGLGLVHRWSILNEPDAMVSKVNGLTMTPEHYYSILAEALPRMKAADPSCEIQVTENSGGDDEWLAAVLVLLDANPTVKACVDAVSYHVYTSAERGGTLMATPGYLDNGMITTAAAWAAANGKALVNSECGGRAYNEHWLSPTEKNDNQIERSENRNDSETNLESFVRAFANIMGREYVGKFNDELYIYDCRFGVGPDNNTQNTFMDQYGRATPVATLLSTILHFFDGVPGAGVIRVGTDLQAYLFRVSPTHTRAVLRWFDDEPGYTMQNKKVSSVPSGVTVYDRFGKEVYAPFLVGSRSYFLDMPTTAVSACPALLSGMVVEAPESDPNAVIRLFAPPVSGTPSGPVLARVRAESFYKVKKVEMFMNANRIRLEESPVGWQLTADPPFPYGDVIHDYEWEYPYNLTAVMTDGNGDTYTASLTPPIEFDVGGEVHNTYESFDIGGSVSSVHSANKTYYLRGDYTVSSAYAADTLVGEVVDSDGDVMFSTLIYFTPPGGGAVSGQYWSAPSTVSGDGLSYLELTTPIQALASIPKSYVMRIGLYNETTGEEITQFVSPTLSAMGWDSLSTCSATVSLCVSRSSDGLLAHSYTIYAGYPTPLSPYTSRIDNLLVDDTSMYLPSVQISTDASISVSSGVSISSDVSISVSTGVVVDADTNISVLTGPTACSAVALYPAPQIRVSWSDIGSGASYQVQWKTSGGSYVDIATVPGSVGSSYVHLVDGSLTHRYRVRNSLSGYSTDWVESSYVSPYNGTKGKTKSVLAGNLNYGMNAGLD